MKHKIFFRIIAITAMCITLFSTCNKNNDDGTFAGVEVTSVTLDKANLTLLVGKTATFTATVLPESATDKTVTWTSSDPTVVEANKGWIAALRPGTATITATTKDGGKTATCNVTVFSESELEMVLVEGGTFMMGCSDDECSVVELPTHQVTLSSFSIGKYPVTQRQWEIIMGSTVIELAESVGYPEYVFGVGDDYPMYWVSWNEAQEFIEKLNVITGKQYRLATEAEWEFAARGGNGSQGYKYSGSDDFDAVAWHSENSAGTSHPVGTKAPNELGIYDMSGGIWEFCNDRYGAYTDEAQTNPQGPTKGSFRVIRGGSWDEHVIFCRVANRMRGYISPDIRIPDFGFRLALSN